MGRMWHHPHRRYVQQPLGISLGLCWASWLLTQVSFPLQVQQLLNTLVTDTEIAEMELQVRYGG